MNRKFDREKYLAAFTVVGEAENQFSIYIETRSPRDTMREIVSSLREHQRRNRSLSNCFPYEREFVSHEKMAKHEGIAVAALRHVWRFRRLAYAEARR